jgi:hypothetical protein
MAKEFKDPAALAAHLKKAMDAQLAETLITIQSELGSTKVSPVDTGRFRASWFASEGSPSSEVPPEADAKAVGQLRRRRAKAAEKNGGEEKRGRGLGSYSPNTDAVNLQVDSSKTYYLTNNLPYAQAVAIEGKVVSQPTTWFTDFLNSRVPKIADTAAKVTKAAFDL